MSSSLARCCNVFFLLLCLGFIYQNVALARPQSCIDPKTFKCKPVCCHG